MQPRRLASRFVWCIAASSCPALLSGQLPLTPVFQVNETSAQYQAPSAIAIDDLGRTLVDYRDTVGFPLEQTGRFIELNSTLSPEFALGPRDGSVGDSGLLSLPAGGWLFSAYSSPPHPLFGPMYQVMDENGSPVGSPVAIDGPDYVGGGHSIAVGPAGGLVVGFTGWPRSHPGARNEMYFEAFSGAGALVLEPVALTHPDPGDPANEVFSGRVGVGSSGRSLVAWGEYRSDSDYDVPARIVDASGNFLTPRFDVNTTRAGTQAGPTGVVAVGGDRFVVVWEGESDQSPYYDVYFRIFASDGTPLTGEVPVSSSPTGARYSGSVATDGGSRFVISWTSDGQDGYLEEIYFREFRADGTAVSDEVRASAGAGQEGLFDEFSYIALSKSGAIVLAWRADGVDADGWGVAGRKYFRGCADGAPRLTLGGGRFEVCTLWTSFSGAHGAGVPVALTTDSGGFWFFGPDNLEVVVKILDGCGTNQRFWLYSAGLTNVEVTLGVIDTWTGQTWIRDTRLATPFPPIQDIEALPGCGALPPAVAETEKTESRPPYRPQVEPAPLGLSNCVEDAQHVCLQAGRFRVSANFRTASGLSGEAVAVPLSGESTAFWFFSATNLELFVKVLDACVPFERFWVFSAGLTNLFVRLRVEDTDSGEIREYENPLDRAFEPILDSSTFATCSAATATTPLL
ncbi:MAG: hypothetical protein ABIV06_08685 [Thermoanaerobaculia bacterium]